MKKILLAALLAGALLSVSCNTDTTLYYNVMEMGRLSGGKILTDSGLTYTIAENTTDYALSGELRVLFVADILQETADLTYAIRLKDILSVPVQDIIPEASLPTAGDDAMRINTAWFGGGYLNLNIGYLVKQASTTEHKFTLVEQTVENGKDTLFLRLYHDADGEIWDGTMDIGESDMSLQSDYYSFPISSFMPTSGTRPVKLQYRWYSYLNDEILNETELYTIKGELDK